MTLIKRQVNLESMWVELKSECPSLSLHIFVMWEWHAMVVRCICCIPRGQKMWIIAVKRWQLLFCQSDNNRLFQFTWDWLQPLKSWHWLDPSCKYRTWSRTECPRLVPGHDPPSRARLTRWNPLMELSQSGTWIWNDWQDPDWKKY